MRHDFNDYVAFMAVAQECSFSRAAVRLGISASTLSHTIRRLEERVGMPLLMRTTRRVAVTEAGKQLLLTLEPGLARIEAGVTALQRLRHTPAGLVRLTVSDHMIHECLATIVTVTKKNIRISRWKCRSRTVLSTLLRAILMPESELVMTY
ncbi:LysR family transcriptional regulator [Enterobacter cloacae complex sp. 326C3]|uniref:LysR family transcriptional regulator n=1 Tax=Enterobacter cloacae complex sp. 326C3 TaxID=3395857 RepID=UPI003CF6CEF1